MNQQTINEFKSAWDKVESESAKIAASKGWYDDPWNIDRALCLIHAEVSEITEALRDGNPPDQNCPAHSSAEIETADIVLRIMDLAQRMKWDLPTALRAKMEFNKTRPYKHGRKY